MAVSPSDVVTVGPEGSDDVLFRSIHTFTGDSTVGHHDFRPGVGKETADAAWSAWLAGVFA